MNDDGTIYEVIQYNEYRIPVEYSERIVIDHEKKEIFASFAAAEYNARALHAKEVDWLEEKLTGSEGSKPLSKRQISEEMPHDSEFWTFETMVTNNDREYRVITKIEPTIAPLTEEELKK